MTTYRESDCHYKVLGKKSKFKKVTTARKASRGAAISKVCSSGGRTRITAQEAGSSSPAAPRRARKTRRKAAARVRKGRCLRWSRGRKRCLKRSK